MMRNKFKIILSLFVCLCLSIPVFANDAPEITVSVGIYDYTAIEYGAEDASENGIISEAEVTVPEGSTAMYAITAALDEAGLSYDVNSQYNYISSIGTLAEYACGPESGWMFCINDNFSNSGAGMSVVTDGDKLALHYSVKGFGTDVGNYFADAPMLTQFSLCGTDADLSALDGDGSEDNPYFISLRMPLSEDITAAIPEVSSTLNRHYIEFSTENSLTDITLPADYNAPINFCLQTIGGFFRTYYTVEIFFGTNDSVDYEPLPDYSGDWTYFRKCSENMGITDAEMPHFTNEAYLKWSTKLAEGWSDAFTPPLIINNAIYIAQNDRVKIINPETGETLQESAVLGGSVGYGLNPIAYGGGMLFIPIGNGSIQALRSDTLESLWISEPLGGQMLTPITYNNGYIYTGTWNGEKKEGTYFCISVEDEDLYQSIETKNCSWKLTHLGGFYWAGAYATTDFVIFGSDDGDSGFSADSSVLYSVNPNNGEIIDTLNGLHGDIRSSIAYDKETGCIYFTTKSGMLYRVGINAVGTFNKENVSLLDLCGMCSATPVVYNKTAFVGVSGSSQFSSDGHYLKAVDVATADMQVSAFASVPGYPQASALLSTASEANADTLYIYITYNANPGGIYALEFNKNSLDESYTLSGDNIFIPEGDMAAYCVCSPICDSSGTIYYKNDSGYLMAVAADKQKGGNNDFIDESTDTSSSEATTESKATAEDTSSLPTAEIKPSVFTDIVGHWAEKYINSLYEKKAVVGKTDTLFSPDDNISRAEFLTLLYRISGVKADFTVKFDDVHFYDWFSDSVSWAAENNIAKGVSETAFLPYSNITREQMAVLCARFMTYMDVTLEAATEKQLFSDDNMISSWAYDDVYQMQQSTLISGRENNVFSPQSFATRAEAAKLLFLISEAVAK